MFKKFLLFFVLILTTLIIGCQNSDETSENVLNEGKNIKKVTGYDYLIERQYDEVWGFENGYVVVKKGEKYGLVDVNGKVIIETTWTNFPVVSEGLVFQKTEKGGKYIDLNGNIVINGDGWSYGDKFNNGVAIVTVREGNILSEQQVILIDNEGNLLSGPWSDIEDDWVYGGSSTFLNGIARVKEETGTVIFTSQGTKKETKVGLIDLKGNLILKPTFDDIGQFYNGYATIVKYVDGIEKYGLIDLNGNIIIDPIYDYLSYNEISHSPDSDLIETEYDGFWGFVNTKGDVIVDFKWDEVNTFHYGLAPVKKDNLWGVIDNSGNLIVDIQYQDVKVFEEGYAAVQKNDLWGFIDTAGKVVCEPKWTNLLIWNSNPQETGYYSKTIHNNKIVVSEDGYNYKLIDVKGKIIIDDFEAIIQSAKNREWKEENNYAFPVKRDGMWQLVSSKDKVLSENYYEYMDNFNEGYAKIKSNGKYGFIDIRGQEIIEPRFDSVHDINDDIAAVMIDGKWGFIKLKYE